MKQLSQIGIAIVFTALAVVTIMDRRAKQPHTVKGRTILDPAPEVSIPSDPDLEKDWNNIVRYCNERNAADAARTNDISNGPKNFP